MASKSYSVNYLAYNADNSENIQPLKQAIASIMSFRLSQIIDNNISKPTVNLSATHDYLSWLDEKDLTKEIDNTNSVKYEHAIIPIIQCAGILEAFERAKEDYIITIDSDTVFLKPYIEELIDNMESSKSDIAIVPECGSTGFKPYSNFNCGLLVMRRNKEVHKLLSSWLSLCLGNKELAAHGNQRLFPHALSLSNPRIFPIDNVYNLRCHPVYGGISQVWSAVYMVHNHQVSNYWVNKLFECLKERNSNETQFRNKIRGELESIDAHFTPSKNPYEPRYVSSNLI